MLSRRSLIVAVPQLLAFAELIPFFGRQSALAQPNARAIGAGGPHET